jgi:hypothetical protein
VNSRNILESTVVASLQLALVMALLAACLVVYRNFPARGAAEKHGQQETSLKIVMKIPGEEKVEAGSVPVELYSVDVIAAQREFLSERRAGQRFEDFILGRMGGSQPVSGRFNRKGEAVIRIPQGKWWVHAVVSGGSELVWRLPVTVKGSQLTIELNPENAYTRTKSF